MTSVFRFTYSYLVHFIRLVPLALRRSPQRCSETRRPWHRFHDLLRRGGIRLRDNRSPSLSAPCRSTFIHNLICIVSITASSQDADFAASTSSLHCSPLILPLARLGSPHLSIQLLHAFMHAYLPGLHFSLTIQVACGSRVIRLEFMSGN